MSKRSESKDRLRRKLAERDGMICFWCKRKLEWTPNRQSNIFPTIDHLLTKRHGGCRVLSNTVLSCRRCNNSGRNEYKDPRAQQLLLLQQGEKARDHFPQVVTK